MRRPMRTVQLSPLKRSWPLGDASKLTSIEVASLWTFSFLAMELLEHTNSYIVCSRC